jgi:citrate lyase subunit beta/citryl-CoA lyase
MAFGAGDYTLDMAMAWSQDESELDDVRARMVLASRAAELEAPIDTVWVQIKDLDGLRQSAERAARMGFQGKMCIYPPQIAAVHEIFSPSAAQIARAKRVVAAFKEAEKAGSASIQLDGAFIDYPIVYKAQRILDTAQRIQTRETNTNP